MRVLTAVLVLQGALYYVTTTRAESIPAIRPLATFPAAAGNWRLLQEGYVDEETQKVLRADDTLTRYYGDASTRDGANLFIAFFKTQRTGKSPHSPKNCLPGSGWEPTKIGAVDVPVQDQTIRINHYVVAKGDYKSVVLYWYQSRDRAVASEYAAKVWMVVDSVRLNRSDTSLVKVTVPVVGGDEARALRAGTRFVQDFYPVLRKHLPS